LENVLGTKYKNKKSVPTYKSFKEMGMLPKDETSLFF